MSKKIAILIGFLFAVVALTAQANLSWKKHVKLADELYANAQYLDAAEHYKAAWKQKSKKLELIYKAGECYYIIKDYQNAADALQHVKEEKDYPLVGLRYARALKQSGQYDAASRELVYFLNNYSGADKQIVTEIVQNEIRGCELGIDLTAKPNLNIEIDHLGSGVNTPETEFAPYAFSDDILYYSSTMAARAEIYRTRKVDGKWIKAERPDGFPEIEKDHFCNGTLSPDGSRFYFTICKSVESWGGLTTQCDIFTTKRIDGKWSTPEPLRDYVNLAGSSTTHPCVVHVGDTEILYFASNREGGFGGMDLWYITRDMRSNDIDFTFPINCGSAINTKGDEITPYFDDEEGALYFASNGRVTIGGYDVFQAVGSKSQWDEPMNIGTPLNSSADDFFFSRTPSRKGGFLVSNRLFGMEKISTTDEDIFHFTDEDSAPKVLVSGNVYDANTEELLPNIMVSLVQYMEGGRKQFLANERFKDGNYEFKVIRGAEYEIEVQRDGYLPNSYVFSTRDMEKREFGKAVYLSRMVDEPTIDMSTTESETISTYETPIATPNTTDTNNLSMEENIAKVEEEVIIEEPTFEEEITFEEPENTAESRVNVRPAYEEPVVKETRSNSTITYREDYNPEEKVEIKRPTSSNDYTASTMPSTGEKYRMYSRQSYEKSAIETAAPRLEGTYYKVQLIAVQTYKEFHSRYDNVRDYGRLESEYLVDRGLTRVLLAPYYSKSEAEDVLSQVQNYKSFARAFIVEYEDGVRVGRVR